MVGSPIFPQFGYALYYDPQPWEEANQVCEKQSGRLVIPNTEEEMKQLLFVMGENYTTIHHIWVGGIFQNNRWRWIDGRDIPMEEEYPPWLRNNSFTESVEDNNRCLNLDRENHDSGVFYGSDCSYPQSFVCKYRKEKIILIVFLCYFFWILASRASIPLILPITDVFDSGNATLEENVFEIFSLVTSTSSSSLAPLPTTIKEPDHTTKTNGSYLLSG